VDGTWATPYPVTDFVAMVRWEACAERHVYMRGWL
jgi:hypothetical protein